MKSATIIIPTIGDHLLHQAVLSVLNQTYRNFQIWIIIDGYLFYDATINILQNFSDSRIKIISLPENTGQNWFHGHRIYAAFGHLVNSEYIFLLDQDNWYDPNHLDSLINEIEHNEYLWAFSLRKICDKNGEFLFNDNCESLGKWPIYLDQNAFMVDTNCYCFTNSVYREVASYWHYGTRADRRVFKILKSNFPSYGTSGLYSVNYRIGGNPKSVTKNFFIRGNQIMKERYNGDYPWCKKSSVLS